MTSPSNESTCGSSWSVPAGRQETGPAEAETAEREARDVEATQSFLDLHEAGDSGVPIVVLEGSSRSGKTWAICQYLAVICAREPTKVFAGRHDGATCERTIVQDFKGAMAQLGLWDRACWNETLKRYTWPNGSLLEFGGTQDVSKLHGLRCDILWLNEVMEISYEAWTQLTMRTTRLRVLDFNPSLSAHWVFDRILTRPEAERAYFHTTYKDNPFLSDVQVVEIERLRPTPENLAAGTADEWRWQVYGLGKRGRREGAIYRLWSVTDDWPVREMCPRWGYGLDFGFSADPTALVLCAVFQDRLYVREVIYETGLVTAVSESVPGLPSIEGRMRAAEVDRDAHVAADSARPDCIRTLSAVGFNVFGVEKKPGSIQAGITLVQGWRLMVHRSAQNVQRELEQYVWKRDRQTGVWLDEPEDANNHAMDALRYWVQAELRARSTGTPPAPAQARTVLRRW